MLSFSLVAEALTGLIYHRPSGENSKFHSTLCLMMGEVSPETSPKNAMIQDMINSETICKYTCCYIFLTSILLAVFVMHLYKYQHTFIFLFLHTSYGLKIFTYLLLCFLHTCMNVSNLLTFIFTYFPFTSILEYAHILACNYSVD